jgi:hypothetical protein
LPQDSAVGPGSYNAKPSFTQNPKGLTSFDKTIGHKEIFKPKEVTQPVPQQPD